MHIYSRPERALDRNLNRKEVDKDGNDFEHIMKYVP